MLKVVETRCLLLSIAALATLLLFYSTSRSYGGDVVSGVRSHTSRIWHPKEQERLYGPAQASAHLKHGQSINVGDIFNETLGFQQIRMISMPDRTDQRDGWSVAASLFGLDYIQADGVDGSTIPAKSRPYTMQQKGKQLGCWRAHLNIWEDMVHNHISSILVFEGDSDWDIGLRAQMLEFAKGSRCVAGEEDTNTLSPYGDDWDLLWLAPWTDRRLVIPHDPTVPPPAARIAFGQPSMSRWEEGEHGATTTRIVYPAFAGTCTASYAISLRGARKGLYKLSMTPNNYAVDIGIRTLCQDKNFGFKCVASWPTIVGTFRPAGNSSAWSDIGSYGSIAEQGHADGLTFSTRMNIDRLLEGKRTFRSSFPDVTGEEMTLEEITSAVGYEERVPLNANYADLNNEELKQIPWDSKDGAVE